MADHFIAIDRGIEGFKQNDFTTGAASSAATAIELRVKDGAGLTKKDVSLALRAFERFLANAQWVAPTGIDVAL